MKKYLILLAAAALAFVGCSKEITPGVAGGDQTVTFSVVAADATKADVTAIPETIDTCVAVVRMYGANDQLLSDIYAQPACTKDGESYKFSVDLMGGQKYEVTVLLYTDGVYTVDDKLEAIERVSKSARNNANLDMFSASINYSAGEPTPLIIARRPFAQLNLITTDLVEHFEPSVVLKYTAPKTFNAVTGVVSGTQVYETVGTYTSAYAPAQCTLSTDYIFASGEKSLISVEMTATKTNAFVRTFDNLPLQRNYKTNVIGKLLTVDSPFTVQVNSDWSTPDNQVNWVSVSTPAAVAAAIEAGATNISIESVPAPTEEVPVPAIEIPKTSAEIGIKLPENNTNPVKIVYKETTTGGQTPTLNVEAQNNTADVEIVAPESHVVLNGEAVTTGEYNYVHVIATTSATSLVIPEGVKVQQLTIISGGIEIHGTVETVVIGEGAHDVVVRDCEGLSESVYDVLKTYIDPEYTALKVDGKWNICIVEVAKIGNVKYNTLQDAIKAALAANDGVPVELINNVVFAEGAEWTPIVFNGGTVAIDGKGYTVNGLPGMLFNKQGSGGHHLRMSNITFDGAKVDDTTGYEAVIVGYADAMNELYFENVVIQNSTVAGSNYAAAFVGYAAGYNVLSNGPVFQEVTFKNCVVDNCTITGGGSAGALMGHATGNAWGNVTVTGTSVKNNTVTSTGSATNKAGSVFGTVGAAGDPNANPAVPEGKVAGLFVSAEVSGNTVKSGSATITTICGRQGSTGGRLFMTAGGSYDAAPYTAADTWASCVEGYGLVENDGVWSVEKLPVVAKIGDTEYATLPEAFVAVKAGETIEIVKAGTYTLPSPISNITIKGAVEGVVFNAVKDYGQSVSKLNGVKFESVKFIFGSSNYTGFQHSESVEFTKCTFEGRFNSYGAMLFDQCTFNSPASDYSMWCYAGDVTYNSCTINCNGKFVNAYNEGNASKDTAGNPIPWKIVVNGCTFNSTKANKAALNIKATCGSKPLYYDVQISNCVANGENWPAASQSETLVVGSALWQVDDINSSVKSGIKVSVDGNDVYTSPVEAE